MGGCITPVVKKVQTHKQSAAKKHIQKDTLNTSFENIGQNEKKAQIFIPPPPPPPPQQQKHKFKKLGCQQFTRMYKVEDNLGTTSRVEGPKYISNYVDGIGKVLRVVPFGSLSILGSVAKETDIQKRLKIFQQNLQLEVMEDDEKNFLVIQDYYCGPFIYELWNKQDSGQNLEKVRRFLSEVYEIIESFHQKNIVLGNLTLFSFRQTSTFDPTVRLVQLNLLVTYDQGMGHAFKAQKSMDWQFYAFLLQSCISQNCPIFIPHKLQYVENANNTIDSLLRGKKIKRQQLDNLPYGPTNPHIILGYRFRSDINKLLKLRKRRQHHRTIYYGEDAIVNEQKLSDEAIQRLETNRIIDRIQKYISELTSQSEEPFLMYSSCNESLNKMKTVFLTSDGKKKMEEFKEVLPLIK